MLLSVTMIERWWWKTSSFFLPILASPYLCWLHFLWYETVLSDCTQSILASLACRDWDSDTRLPKVFIYLEAFPAFFHCVTSDLNVLCRLRWSWMKQRRGFLYIYVNKNMEVWHEPGFSLFIQHFIPPHFSAASAVSHLGPFFFGQPCISRDGMSSGQKGLFGLFPCELCSLKHLWNWIFATFPNWLLKYRISSFPFSRLFPSEMCILAAPPKLSLAFWRLLSLLGRLV